MTSSASPSIVRRWAAGLVLAGAAAAIVAAPALAAAPRISPKGAPYSYALPAGFARATNVTVTQEKGAARFRSGVGIDKINLIATSVYPQRVDLDTISNAQLDQVVTRDIVPLLKRASTKFTGPRKSRIAGARAYRFLLGGVKTPTGQTVTNETYFLFKGRNELQILCQWRPDKKKIMQRGCATVRGSLTLKG